jgi:hypothetical protein
MALVPLPKHPISAGASPLASTTSASTSQQETLNPLIPDIHIQLLSSARCSFQLHRCCRTAGTTLQVWLQIMNGAIPVASWSVPDVYFTQSMLPAELRIADDYVVRYTAFICQHRTTGVAVLLCSDDQVMVLVDGKQVCGLPVALSDMFACAQAETE